MNDDDSRGPGDPDAHGYPEEPMQLTPAELEELNAWLDALHRNHPIF